MVGVEGEVDGEEFMETTEANVLAKDETDEESFDFEV